MDKQVKQPTHESHESRIAQIEHEMSRRFIHDQKLFRTKYRMPYALAVAFGFVTTVYGLEHMLNRVDFFMDNPWIMFAIGVIVLSLTGAIYKRFG